MSRVSVAIVSTPFAPAILSLQCFVGVVEAGSFAAAARRLGMTTSGVSRAISRFETEHRVRLLHRSTRALSLTEPGEQVLEEAREVLRGSEQFGLALSQAADGGRAGRVRISAPPGFVRACLVSVLPQLLHQHPEIRIDLQASYDMVDLAGESVDLAIRTGRLAGIPGHVCRRLFASPWCAYASPEYLAKRGTPAAPDDLARHDLIGFRNSATGRVGNWRFRMSDVHDKGEAAFHPSARIVFDDGSAAFDMARDGYGIVWAPQWLALNDVRLGRIVEVLSEWRADAMPISIIYRERRLTPKRVRAVIDFIRGAAGAWHVATVAPAEFATRA